MKKGIKFIIVHENKVLVETKSKGKFNGQRTIIPGGHVEENETVEQALKRELLEELSVWEYDSQLLTTQSHDFGEKIGEYELSYFLVSFSEYEFTEKIDNPKWVSFDIAQTVLDTFDAQIIKRLREEIEI